MFVMPAFHSSLLCKFAANDAGGARQIGGAEMQEHREVSGLITRSEAQRCIVKLESQVQRYRICSSRVNSHATHMGASAW